MRGAACRACPRSTTQIDGTLRLSSCTDSQPGPTQYPKHGSRGGTPGTPPPAPPSRASEPGRAAGQIAAERAGGAERDRAAVRLAHGDEARVQPVEERRLG